MSYVKYPRTCPLPRSLGQGSDDTSIDNTTAFKGKEVVVKAKMHGRTLPTISIICMPARWVASTMLRSHG